MARKKSTWGRTIGLILGLLLFPRLSLLGLGLGYWLGSVFDRAIDRLAFISGHDTHSAHNLDPTLMRHLFALSGFVAKADGIVSQQEIQAVSQFMKQWGLTPEETQKAIGYFNDGKNRNFHLEHCLQQLRLYVLFHQDAKAVILDLIKRVGEADQPIPPAKHQVIQHIFALFGRSIFHGDHFTWEGWQHRHAEQPSSRKRTENLHWAYDTLQVKADDSMTTITKRYRKLLSQNHPDRLQSRQKSPKPEDLQAANEKTRQIKKAFDVIKQSRGE